MAYKINGTDLLLQPTAGKWIERDELAIDGNGMPVYPQYRSFELTWELIDEASLYQLQDFFDTLIVTGSIVATLPKYKANAYAYFDYTGCVMHEPTFDAYWEQYVGSARLLISRIKT